MKKALQIVPAALRFAYNVWLHKHSLRLMLSKNYVFLESFPPGHFYSPIPDLDEAIDLCGRVSNSCDDGCLGVALNEDQQLSLMRKFAQFYDEIPFPIQPKSGFRYYFDNPFFSFGDCVVLYSILRNFRPKRIVEVGSGFSSAAMLDLDERFFGNTIEFTFIEPYPKRLNDLLSSKDKSRARIEATRVQNVSVQLFESLQEGDILFVDSSHVGKAGSDLLHILFMVLPHLERGVLIHFHDIFWPFEYPSQWFQGGRAWNEAYYLRSFLQYNAAFEILFFNSFMADRHQYEMREMLPAMLSRPTAPETFGNSSLWLQKNSTD